MRPLKPFEGPSPTGFYNFNGKPLDQSEVDTLRAKGVRIPEKPFDWNPIEKKSPGYNSKEWDIMPDNRLKDTKFRMGRQETGEDGYRRPKTRTCAVTEQEFTENMAKWREEWTALPEPRQDFITWFANNKSDEIGKQLLYDAFRGARSGQAAKALSVLLEFGKIKPKSITETIPPDVRPATVDELLAAVAALTGKPIEFVREVFAEKPTQ